MTNDAGGSSREEIYSPSITVVNDTVIARRLGLRSDLLDVGPADLRGVTVCVHPATATHSTQQHIKAMQKVVLRSAADEGSQHSGDTTGIDRRACFR